MLPRVVEAIGLGCIGVMLFDELEARRDGSNTGTGAAASARRASACAWNFAMELKREVESLFAKLAIDVPLIARPFSSPKISLLNS